MNIFNRTQVLKYMLHGGVSLSIGIIITAMTYSNPGIRGEYIFAGGAMCSGIISLIRGIKYRVS